MSASGEIEVHLGGGDNPVHVGTLRPSFQGGRTLAGSSFEYSASYLSAPDAYEISPDLPLAAGRKYTPQNQTIFGAFDDAAPDQWGEKVIDANHALRLKRDPSLPRRIGAFDYLLGVSDATRMGALRLRSAHGTWLAAESSAANLHDLDKIAAAARRYDADEATDEDVEYLGEIATSPGGARPKANVLLPDGALALAKLPHSKDRNIDAEAWEALALTIAGNAGVATPSFDLHKVAADKSVLVVRRFDRTGDGGRVGYMSAATVLGIGSNDDSRVTYEEFADAIAELSARPPEDLREMFARVALTVLTNNVDDHWRNHGFLRDASGWRLAPAFDINPSPRRGTVSSRAISSEDDPRARDIRNLIDTAEAYHLPTQQATAIVRRVGAEVDRWPTIARSMEISAAQIERMSGAFDEEQLDYARSMEESASTVIPMSAPPASQPAGAVWVEPHTRNGKPVDGYWRARPTA